MKWLSALEESPKRLFVTHGETEAANSFSEYIRDKMRWKVSVPAYQKQVLLR